MLLLLNKVSDGPENTSFFVLTPITNLCKTNTYIITYLPKLSFSFEHVYLVKYYFECWCLKYHNYVKIVVTKNAQLSDFFKPKYCFVLFPAKIMTCSEDE